METILGCLAPQESWLLQKRKGKFTPLFPFSKERTLNDHQEYCAVKVIPMSQVIEAAEIEPVSRSKNFCLQVIAEEKSYQLCTLDEESLTKWLGGLKSIIIARKKLEASASATA